MADQVGDDLAARIRRETGLLNDEELASLFRITLPTLADRRSRGKMPPSAKVAGRQHLTRLSDALAWIDQRKVVKGGHRGD